MRLHFRLLLFIVPCMLLAGAFLVHADTSDIQSKIDDTQNQINQLQQDIAKLQQQLDATSKQKQTLQSTLSELTLSQKKLQTQITLTQTQIHKVDLEIQTLSTSIATTSNNMDLDRGGIAATMRDLNESDESPVALVLLSGNTLSSMFDELASLTTIRTGLQNQISDLTDLKTTLQTSKNQAQQKHDELSTLNAQLTTQRQSLTATINSQNQLLAQTKNQESSYQKLLQQKQAQEKQFEQDLNNLQSQLTTKVDTSTLPHPGSGVLSWPFSASFMNGCSSKAAALQNNYCITQYFGSTPFATANPQVYNGHGHDGIDIAAPIGTPVEAALNGTVAGTGNTDVGGCYSYGKWVLITHPNGISTLYAHLSSIQVSSGEKVSGGDVIGYSGMTGYATGPHLHFSVYASDAVQIMNLGSWYSQNGQAPTSPCSKAGVSIPVAPWSGYLNPLSYL